MGKALAHVWAHGDAAQEARLAIILWDQPPSAKALRDLATLQQPEGSWASEEGEGEAQAPRSTVDALRALKSYRRIVDVPGPAKSQGPPR